MSEIMAQEATAIRIMAPGMTYRLFKAAMLNRHPEMSGLDVMSVWEKYQELGR